MKLLRRRRWLLIAGFTGGVILTVYLLAPHILEQRRGVAPTVIAVSDDADEYYDENEQDSAGGSLLFPARGW
jgi:hypothetical protein